MNDAQLSPLEIAELYAEPLESAGLRDWLGLPGAADPVAPEDLRQAAEDTVRYLQSRPLGPESPRQESTPAATAPAPAMLPVAEPEITPSFTPAPLAAEFTRQLGPEATPIANLWRRVGAAAGNFLYHPERGARRRTLVAIGTAALSFMAGTFVAYMGARHGTAHDHTMVYRQPEYPPDLPPHPPPPKDFFDNLEPQAYHGQTYEWSALADQLGPARATPALEHMIEQTRTHGAAVHTWGSPNSGHWGVNDVTVTFQDGSHATYYDTPHKLALLEHFQRLSRLEDDDE